MPSSATPKRPKSGDLESLIDERRPAPGVGCVACGADLDERGRCPGCEPPRRRRRGLVRTDARTKKAAELHMGRLRRTSPPKNVALRGRVGTPRMPHEPAHLAHPKKDRGREERR